MAGIDLNDVAVFVRVVELGAFSKVARELGVPTSTVSRSIARLEAQTGAALLQRSSRSVQTTGEGRVFYAQVSPALATMQRAARGIEATDQAPRGLLRVTAPNDLGSTFLPDVVVAFTERYPLVEVELVLTTRMVNLIDERVDVALRAGNLPDSSLIARRLGETHASIYAAPSYLAAHGAPATLAALADHRCILFRPREGESLWKLHGPEGEVTQRVRGRLGGDDYVFVRSATIAGVGIALLPEFLAVSALATGALVPVLPQYKLTGVPLHFVHAPARVVAPKITAFRDVVVEAFARLGTGR